MAEVAGINPATSAFFAAHVERPGVDERPSPKVNIGRRARRYFTD